VIVTVVWATPNVQDLVPVELPPGATVADALRDSGLVAHYSLDVAVMRFARFGIRVDAHTLVSHGDRIEIVRRLVADPKVARVRRVRGKTPATATPRNVRRSE
jgi:uncharacterized protein